MAQAILKAQPRNVDVLVLLALMARSRFDLTEVDRLMRAALQVRPKDRYLRLLHAQNRLHLTDPDGALAASDQALQLFPDDVDFLLLKAMAYEALFAHEKALAILEPLLSHDDARAEAHGLAGRLLHGLGRYDEAIECMRSAAMDPANTPEERRTIWFQLFKTYDKLANYDRAIDACAQAHLLQPNSFHPESFRAHVDALIRTYSGPNLRLLARSSCGSNVPVFIVGMPRSGTTLVEQIIHAHPDAFGAGELMDIPNIAKSITAETGSMYPFPDSAADLTVDSATRLGNSYIAGLQHLGGEALRIVNKMPHDYEHVGLIWQLLPAARIIHVLRDPLDTCLSCYTRQLVLATMPYADHLEHLGFVYREHERLMNHWKTTLDIQILTIRYEDLVANQERGSRQIIDFLGLPWNDLCLRYWEAKRTILTLSADQVNKPIYDSSIGRWRNYESHLGPLKKALGLDADRGDQFKQL